MRVAAVAGGALRVSDNGGRVWQDIELPAQPLALWESKAEGASSTLYVAMAGGGLAASNDGGLNWNQLPPIPATPTHITAGQASDGLTLLVARNREEGVLLLGTPEKGEWKTLFSGDLAGAAQDPNSGNLYAATSAGVQRSDDLGATWAMLPNSPANANVLTSIPGPTGKPPTILAGTPNGLYASADGSETWHRTQLPHEGGVVALARDPERRDRVYAALSTGYLCESANRGIAWELINSQPLPPIHSLYVIRI